MGTVAQPAQSTPIECGEKGTGTVAAKCYGGSGSADINTAAFNCLLDAVDNAKDKVKCGHLSLPKTPSYAQTRPWRNRGRGRELCPPTMGL